MEITDEELIYNIYLGNREAKELLYFRYEKKMGKTMKQYEITLKKNGYLKEDIEGLIWEYVGKSLGKYESKKGAFFPYCQKIVKMDLIDKLRKRSYENYGIKVDNQIEDKDISYCETFADSSVNLERAYNLTEVIEMIKELGEKEYLIFELLYKGYSYKEIADIMKVSFKKVCNIVCSMRKKIKDRLNGKCLKRE